ncbi:MAG: SPFH domain-containing protein [Planctomycetota bacterium]
MGFFDALRGELIDIVEFLDDSNDTMVYRFERYDNEIKNGAQLIVRPGQMAVFVDQGKIADVFAPGRVRLTTDNIPILSTLRGWKYGFDSPFKAEVYFVSTRQFTDLKWGTRNPIMMRDPEFGPIRLRAFGTYAVRVADPAKLIQEIAGTDGHFTTGEITEQLRNIITARFADAVASEQTAALDMAASYDEFGELIKDKIAPEFDSYGVELVKFLVENISLPPAVEKALDKRTSMGVIGNMKMFNQYQAGLAMEKAAENPGQAGGAMGMFVGANLANQIGTPGYAQPQAAAPAAPPPPPPPAGFHLAVNGQTLGPYNAQRLGDMMSSGEFTPESLVWQAGMPGWTPAGQVPALARLFPPPPPPAPPAPPTS